MHFTCRPFIGKPNATNWSQYWENEPDDPILIKKRGHLFGLINLGIEFKEEDLSIIGHDIIYELNQNYFSCDTEDEVQECLKNALITVTNNPLYQTSKLELLIAVILKNNLYLISYGLGKVIISRSNKISLILGNEDQEIKALSGPLFSEDKIFLTTHSFFDQFTWGKIKTILSDEKIENIEENFLSDLYAFDDQSGLAAVLIQPHTDEDQEPDLETEEITEPSLADFNQFSLPPIPKKNLASFFKKNKNDSVYVSHHEISQLSKRKKTNLIIAIVLILGLLTSFYFGYQKNQSAKNETKYQNLKSELDRKFTDITAVKNINLNSAQLLARDSESIIQQMTNLNIHLNEVSGYQSQIQQILSQSGASDHFIPNLFYDTSISFKNSQYSKLILKDNSLFFLDAPNGRIDSLDIAKKLGKNIAINETLKNVNFLTINNGELYVANKDNLFLIKNNLVELKTTFDSNTINLTDIKFWNGAIYLLDSSNSAIWKLTPNSTGFGVPQSWIKNDGKLEANATSLAINSNIFVLYQNGQVTSYTSGVKQDFKLVQQEASSQANSLNLTLSSGIFAFIDNQNLIYVYKKTGELQSKYNFDKLKITDIVIDDKNGFIYVLCTDQKIYQVKI